MEKELLCHNCKKLVPYTIRTREHTREILRKFYTYTELYATCDTCNSEISFPGLEDNNEKIFFETVGKGI